MQRYGATRATWIATIAAVLAIPISLFSVGYTIWSDRIRFREDLILNVTAVTEDYPTQLNEVPGTTPSGTLATYWSIIVANNSDRDVSIVEYDLQEIRGEGDKVRYPSLNQGLFTTYLSPLDLPLNIRAGNAMRFYLKVGLLMDTEAFGISKDFWQAGTVASLRRLVEYLTSKDFDIYGRLEKRVLYEDLKKGSRRGQTFLVTLRTARRTGLQATFSSSAIRLFGLDWFR
jgi:hypothetical protein